MKKDFGKKASELFAKLVRAGLSAPGAANEALRIRQSYPGLPTDEVAELLIKRAARKTKWEGAGNGLAVTGCEAVVISPIPEPSHKTAASAGAVALLLTDIAYATKVQMQLLLTIAELYECPFDPDDEEDVYTIFKAALGLKGTERVGSYGRYVFTETARKQFRLLLRTGVRRAVQDRVIKLAGPRIGVYLSEKYVMRLIPVANALIGYAFNNAVTKAVGKWAKVRAKIRSSTFKHAQDVRRLSPDAVVWILPTIFFVGTSSGSLTEATLTLYAQCAKRLGMSDAQEEAVREVIDAEDIADVLKLRLGSVEPAEARVALLEIAVTTAAINLEPNDAERACVSEVASWLNVEYHPSKLDERVRFLRR